MATLDASDDPRAQEVCNICLTRLSRYTCPRCNVRYCSLACYRHKKHLQCSESFYRDSVIAELQQMKGSGEERRQVMETLMRMQKGEVEDFDDQTEDHAETLEARVAGLDLDKDLDLVWQRLSPSEQQQFNQLVQSGQLGHLFPPYSPWWEVFTSVVEEEQSSPQKPSVLSCLPPLNSLISDSKVSPCISYNILNVLYAYAYTVRLYNGDHMELAVQASQAVLDISGTLSSNALFYTTRDALRHAVTTVQQRKDLFTSFESSISVMRDVAHILCHPRSHACQVQEALSDLHRLLSTAKAAAKADGAVEATDVQGLLKQLHRVAKKVFFFVVWSNVHAEELASMSDAVCLECETSLKELQAYEEIEQKVKAVRLPASSSCHTAPQPLIELLN